MRNTWLVSVGNPQITSVAMVTSGTLQLRIIYALNVVSRCSTIWNQQAIKRQYQPIRILHDTHKNQISPSDRSSTANRSSTEDWSGDVEYLLIKKYFIATSLVYSKIWTVSATIVIFSLKLICTLWLQAEVLKTTISLREPGFPKMG